MNNMSILNLSYNDSCLFLQNLGVIGALRHNLQERLSGRSRDEIYIKLRTSTGKLYTWPYSFSLHEKKTLLNLFRELIGSDRDGRD